ncbi:MAG: hypothetical protein AAF790_02455 [Planctomycetota bacterium]
MSDANPYQSPNAAAADSGVSPIATPLLPRGRLLLGLLLAPAVTAVAFVLLQPAAWVAGRAIDYLLSPYGAYFGGFIWDYDAHAIRSKLFFGGFNALIAGVPLVLYGRRRRRVTPKRVLCVGGLIAAFWWLGLSAPLHYALALSKMPDIGGSGGDPVLSQPWLMHMIIKVLVDSLFVAGLPLFCGAAAYAWWVRRLQRAADRGAAAATPPVG